MSKQTLGRAVVIGGSMAGILTAQALSDRFERVTVIERDRLPQGPELRKGVPQARHVHALWAGGMQVIESMLPDVRQTLLDAGALPLAFPTDMAWLTPADRWLRPFPATMTNISSSRPLLEWAVRSHVQRTPNIRFLEDHEVTALRLGPRGSISGVAIRDRANNAELDLSAELVVDASGRSSKLPQWLEALGLPTPEETTVDGRLGYATRVYEVPPGLDVSWKGLYIQPAAPEGTRGGIMFPVEAGRWVLTLIGAAGDHAPTDEEGFVEFARSLRSPLISDAIAAARPLSPIWGYRRTANRRRHYERLRMPTGLLAIGDSLCAFNPVYGQGMSVAAKEAAVLRDLLSGARSANDLPRVLRRAQQKIAKPANGPWLLSTGNDLRYPSTTGGSQNPVDRLVNRYLDRVIAAVADDELVNARFVRVVNLLDEPPALFSPRVAARVLRRRRFGPSRLPDPVRISAYAAAAGE